jgi:predicted nuclease with RNAse H fold
MLTVGVDLSVAPERTAAASIMWEGGEALVAEPLLGLDDERLVSSLAEAEWVGIDAPFGWPEEMVMAIHDYATTGRWPSPDKQAFRYRLTDRLVHEQVLAEAGRKLWPLSVTSDRIALTAWRLAQLRELAHERSGIRFDRSGADRVVEVYPAAALLLWDLERAGYKASAEARGELLAAIEARAPWLAWAPGAREACVSSDDALDAVLAALIARAAGLGLTAWPQAEQLARARGEGWVHLPRKGSLPELVGF